MALQAQVPDRPNPPRTVNDFADIFSANQERTLERKLRAYNDSTSTQIVVVVLESLGGDSPFMVASDILSGWGIGQQGKDNGLVILIAPNERETFISTGYGLEATLPDITCSQIIQRYMLPYFREGDYYGGVNEATTAIMGVLSGEFTADDIAANEGIPFGFILFIMVFLIFFVILPAMNSKRRYDNTGRTYTGRGMRPRGPIIIHHGSDDWGSFSGGSGNFGGGFDFGGGMGGGGGAGGSW